jgi:DNA-binding MarR family transcriptional regulator
VKSKTVAAPPPDTTLDTLATFVHTLRTLNMTAGGHQFWLGLDLTMVQFKAVLLLVLTGGMTSRKLADQLGVGPSAVTQLVDRLVDQKLARREADETDRRVAWIRPTAKAVTLQDELLQTSRSTMADVLDGLHPRDRALVQQALRLLLDRAEAVLNARRP